MAKIKARKTAAEKPLPVPVHFAVGWAAGALVLAAMLLLSAWLVSAMGLPLGALQILMLLSAAVGSLAAGWVTARRYGQKGLLCGAAAGGLLFIAWLAPAGAVRLYESGGFPDGGDDRRYTGCPEGGPQRAVTPV